MAATVGYELPAADLSLLNLANLQEQLAVTQNTLQRVMFIENWLLQQVQQRQLQTGLIQQLWTQLLKAHDLNALSQSLHLSRRQIERKFQLEIGLSPAYIKLLHNVKAARRLIVQAPQLSLVDIGLECGFYDQAHFTRQFQKITQQTPGQYRLKKMSQIYNSSS